jgi:dipeptidyl aminopeptidase/acylaminoacyl peptidase
MKEIKLTDITLFYQEVPSVGGRNAHVYVSLPETYTPSKSYPLFVLLPAGIHGGFRDKYAYTDGSSTNQFDTLHLNIMRMLNRMGIIACTLDRRGAHGYGEEYLYHTDIGGDEVEDILHGTEYLLNEFSVDRTKVAGLGASRSALALAKTIEEKHGIFKLAILSSGFYDIRKQMELDYATRTDIFPVEQVVGKEKLKDFPFEARSPMHHVEKLDGGCYVILTHGEDDPYALASQSTQFYEEMVKYGKRGEVKLFDVLPHTKESSDPLHTDGKKLWEYLTPRIIDLLKLN